MHTTIMLLIVLFGACADKQARDAETKGKFTSAITETGELHAVNSKVITVPFFNWDYGRSKLIWLEEEGVQVQKGDLVAQLDTSSVKRAKVQQEADLDIALADLEKMKVEHASQLEQLTADLKSAEATLKLARIDTQRVKYESETKRQISRLKLRIAEVMYTKAQNKITRTKAVQHEELLIQQAKIAQIESAITNAQRTLERFGLRAPANGIVEYHRDRRSGQKIRVGDEFWPGRPLLGLPDLSQMKVLTTVNETDIDKIQLGQKVLVRLDAYPKVTFEGDIHSISITCHEKDEKSKIKVFDVEVLLEKSDPILKPGMTVSCEIVIDVLRVPSLIG